MRIIHNVVQVIALLIVAWSVWKLAGIGWAGLALGGELFGWSVLTELATPRRKRSSEPNLREVA